MNRSGYVYRVSSKPCEIAVFRAVSLVRQAMRRQTVAPHEPTFREWSGEGSLVAFVVSLNLHRRHLDESQRAMVAAKIANMPSHRPEDKSANLQTYLLAYGLAY